jgi:hypothetical protein
MADKWLPYVTEKDGLWYASISRRGGQDVKRLGAFKTEAAAKKATREAIRWEEHKRTHWI